jgi:TRAP-type transport system periplasmic protein
MYSRNTTRSPRPPAAPWSPRRGLAGLLLALAILAGCAGPPAGVTVVNLGGTTTPNTPGEAMWLTFRQRAEAGANGRLQLRPLIYGQLGSEEQLLSGLRRGRIQFANLSAQSVSTVVPELALLYSPYLFASAAEADYVYDRYLTPVFRDLLAARDLHLVTWYEIGFSQIWARQSLVQPADVQGRRFRVAPSLNARLFAASIRADAIPLGFGEIVSSLQTGLIDAGENAVSLYAHTGIADEAPHLTLTNHAFGVSLILTRESWWRSLPAADRAVLANAFPGAAETRLAVRAQTAADLAAGTASGFTAHSLTAPQRAEWERAVASVGPQLVTSIGGRSAEILAGIAAARQRFRAAATR